MRSRFFGILLVLFLVSCSSPIEKKKKEFQNCKVKLEEVVITKYNLVLLPPIPKIYFRMKLSVDNQNDEEVTIQKFGMEILSAPSESHPGNLKLSQIQNTSELKIPPLSSETLELDLVTTLEENPDKEIYKLVVKIIKSLLKNEDMEFLVQGSVSFSTWVGDIKVPVKEIVKTRMRL